MSAARREKIEALLQQSPDDAELIYALALEHVSEGTLDHGLTLLQELNRTLPTYIPAHVQAGQLLLKLGREDEARAAFTTGIEQARRVGDHHAAGEMAGFLDAIS